ncbi:MAG: hypothetical protein CM15mP120_12710 [Pseudomonadota bacterium]|nr:MAG: hypothetical protein CM15mP120_12710 [Pseudomonadota bacterium]
MRESGEEIFVHSVVLSESGEGQRAHLQRRPSCVFIVVNHEKGVQADQVRALD